MVGNQGKPGQELESRDLLYPHTYPHIDTSAIADELVHIESAAPIPTIAADTEADRHLIAWPFSLKRIFPLHFR